MPRSKTKSEDTVNITINFSKEEYDFIVSKAKTEYGVLSYGQVVRAIVSKFMKLETT